MQNRHRLTNDSTAKPSSAPVEQNVTRLTELLRKDPRNARLINQLGDILMTSGQKDQAVEHYRRAVKYFEEAGSLQLAVAVCRKMLRMNPGLLEVYVKLGYLYARQGLIKESVAQYSMAADTYLAEERHTEALATYRRIVKLTPNDLKTQYQVARLQEKLGSPEDAHNTYNIIIAKLVSRGSLAEALELCDQVIRLNPTSIPSKLSRARVLSIREDSDKAIAQLDEVLETNPENVEALELLGNLSMQGGQNERAVEAFEALLKLDESRAEVQVSLGTIHLRQAQDQTALEYFLAAVDRYLEWNQWGHAESIIKMLADIDSEKIPVLERMERLYEHKGESEKHASVSISLAQKYADSGHNFEAMKTIERALDLSPDNGQLTSLRNELLPKIDSLLVRAAADDAESVTASAKKKAAGVPDEFEINIEALIEAENKDPSGRWNAAQLRLAAAAMEDSVLYELSLRDPLTNLYTKAHFKQRLLEEIKRTRRYRYPTSVMIIDIDGFSRIRDKFGDETSETIVAEVAGILIQSTRESDLLARFGRDSFALLLPYTELEQAEPVGVKLCRNIREGLEVQGLPHLSATVSIGISSNETHEFASAEDFLEATEKSLLVAKNAGGDTVAINNKQNGEG